MDKKKLTITAIAAALTGSAVAFGLIDSKESAWAAFKTVFFFLAGVQ